MVKLLYENRAAARFRQTIRPSMVGNIASIEGRIAPRAAAELNLWMRELVQATLRSTRLQQRRGELTRQLNQGIRVTGRGSLATLTGAIWVQPWVFAHEYGAKITPKRGKYLAIPIFYGLRSDGSPVFRDARSWDRYGSFVYTSRDERKFLAHRTAGRLRITHVLVEDIEIPARLGLHRMSDRMLGELLGAWGMIYVQEMYDDPRVINLWGRRQ